MAEAQEIINVFMRSQHKFKAFAYSILLNWTLAEDALQDTAVYLYNHKDEYEEGTNAEAWIITIVKFRCYDIIHKEKSERAKAKRLSEKLEPFLVNAKTEDLSDQTFALKGCIEALPAKTKEIVLLYYEERRMGLNISSQLKMKEDAIYKILSRARALLKNCVQNKLKEV